MKTQGSQDSQNNLGKKKAEGFTLPNFKHPIRLQQSRDNN